MQLGSISNTGAKLCSEFKFTEYATKKKKKTGMYMWEFPDGNNYEILELKPSNTFQYGTFR